MSAAPVSRGHYTTFGLDFFQFVSVVQALIMPREDVGMFSGWMDWKVVERLSGNFQMRVQ